MLKSPFQHNLTAKRFSNELTNKLLKLFLLAWPVQAKIADSRIRFVKRVILFLFFMQFLQGRSARLTNKGGFFNSECIFMNVRPPFVDERITQSPC